jgi:hypothetical protein
MHCRERERDSDRSSLLTEVTTNFLSWCKSGTGGGGKRWIDEELPASGSDSGLTASLLFISEWKPIGK